MPRWGKWLVEGLMACRVRIREAGTKQITAAVRFKEHMGASEPSFSSARFRILLESTFGCIIFYLLRQSQRRARGQSSRFPGS